MVGQLVGKYRILKQLGQGGMGLVYEGLREDIRARAAIKILRPEYAQHDETARRFFNEARAVNIIKHPAIVRIFDYGRLDDGSAYLAMELLEGETLRSRILRSGRISESDSIRLGRQIASGLAAAHAKQIVHRDLKPDNVFIVPDTEAPGGERTKILDFGIAKLMAHSQVQTARDIQLGTPLYMAPEQFLGAGEVNDRADVYSRGVILFEMLSGQLPFFSKRKSELMAMHLDKPPPSLYELVPGIDLRLQELIEGMLHKSFMHRPVMTDVAQKLKHLGNLSSDVMTPEMLERLANESRPELHEAPTASRLEAMPAPAPVPIKKLSEATTQRLPSRDILLSELKPMVLAMKAQAAEPAPPVRERSAVPLQQRPWVIPVLCLLAAALLCVLVLLSE